MSEISILKTIDNNASAVSLRSDGIALIFMKPDLTLTLADAHDIVNALEKIGEGKKLCLLFIAGNFTLVNTDARAYASSPEGNKYTIASAFVVNNIAQKLMGNAYITFNKPTTPTKLFTSENEAVKWLSTFL